MTIDSSPPARRPRVAAVFFDFGGTLFSYRQVGGGTAFVIRDSHGVAAYLFGFLSQAEPVGYIHLTAVRSDCRRKGYASALHRHFCDTARAKGCTAVKAIALPSNAASVAFHTRMGMRMLGAPNAQGVKVEKDHSGPGEDRVVFWKDL